MAWDPKSSDLQAVSSNLANVVYVVLEYGGVVGCHYPPNCVPSSNYCGDSNGRNTRGSVDLSLFCTTDARGEAVSITASMTPGEASMVSS